MIELLQLLHHRLLLPGVSNAMFFSVNQTVKCRKKLTKLNIWVLYSSKNPTSELYVIAHFNMFATSDFFFSRQAWVISGSFNAISPKRPAFSMIIDSAEE